eukprot:1159071-Pelagomonas_calceolata.AAC.2
MNLKWQLPKVWQITNKDRGYLSKQLAQGMITLTLTNVKVSTSYEACVCVCAFLTCKANSTTVAMPKKLWGEYKLGMGVGSFRLWLAKAAQTPKAASTTAHMCRL